MNTSNEYHLGAWLLTFRVWVSARALTLTLLSHVLHLAACGLLQVEDDLGAHGAGKTSIDLVDARQLGPQISSNGAIPIENEAPSIANGTCMQVCHRERGRLVGL